MAMADITTAKKGDIVRLKSYSLRVETDPDFKGATITLRGRISIDGCPLVTKRFVTGLLVEIERKEPTNGCPLVGCTSPGKHAHVIGGPSKEPTK
jgi:hypothetical protein